MAILKGKGSMTGINVLAKVYDNGVSKDGKTHFIDAQIDARDARGAEQTNLHLKSELTTSEDGTTRFNNGAAYSTGQMEEIIKAAGPNTEPVLNKDGEKVGTLYAVKANLMPANRGTGLVLNTKSLAQSDFKVGPDTLTNQLASMKAAKEAREAAKAAAPEQTVEAEQAVEQQVQVDEPSVG